MVIDGLNDKGDRCSISLDNMLWALYIASFAQVQDRQSKARAEIKERLKKGIIKNSKEARRFVYSQVVKPSVYSAFIDSEIKTMDHNDRKEVAYKLQSLLKSKT